MNAARAVTSGQMTAAVLYGSENLRIEQIAIPQLAADEVLVRVKVALTDGTDLKVWRRGYHARMLTPPALFGHELAGEIAALGTEVRGFQVGDRVVPANSAPCMACFFCRKGQPNLCEDIVFNNGAYAEYIRIPGRIVRHNMLKIPDHVDYLDAALIEPLACVLRGVDEMSIRAGDTAALIGCGPIGLTFVKMLAVRGVNVIALGKRAVQLQNAKRLGAAAVLDVTQLADPVAAVRDITEGGRGADSAVEAAGVPEACAWALKMVRKGGTVNWFAGCHTDARVELEPAGMHYSEITLKSTFHHTPYFIREALAAVERGDIRASDFITGRSPLGELPRVFEQMKSRTGELKTAVIP
jgi:L-iditol 2-dehydrogenase